MKADAQFAEFVAEPKGLWQSVQQRSDARQWNFARSRSAAPKYSGTLLYLVEGHSVAPVV